MAVTDPSLQLADALIAALPKLTAAEQKLAVALLRLLARGEPVAEARLAHAMSLGESDVRETLARWAGIYRDEQARVVGFMGLSVLDLGDHRLHLGGRVLSAWCAWDALFLPGLLERTAHVTSRCPTTSAEISLTVTAAGPIDVRPAEAVISFLAPDKPFDADVVRSFCHFVHFFSSESAALRWTGEHPGTFTLPIGDGYEVGQITNRSIFGAPLYEAPAI